MSSIAWAIVFIGITTQSTICEIWKPGYIYTKTEGIFTLISLIMLILTTVKDLTR